MPISLTQIASNTATVTFRWGEETVSIEYRPSLITEKTLAKLQMYAKMDASDFAETFMSLNEMLAGKYDQSHTIYSPGIIKSWDVYEDEAQTQLFPIDAERFAELPMMFRAQLLQEIIKDMRPETIAPQ